MKKRIIPVALVATLCVGLAAWWLLSHSTEASNDKIFVSGNIEAIEVDLSFRIGGQINSLSITEGDRVKSGQAIAELDTDTLVVMKKAAEAEIGGAQAALDELHKGAREEEIEVARAAEKAAESRLKNARAEHERYHPLFREGAISASAFDAKDMALKVATEDHRSASERLRELELGPREERIRAAASRLEKAKWELRKIELDLKHSVLNTPIEGVVLVKSNEVGEVVLPGATVATVAGIDEVWLKGYVSEKHLGKVKLSQKVELITDSYPNKKYQGRVTFVSSRAEFTPKNVQTREERIKQVYRVKVTIPNPHQELKIGMPAEGYILINEAPDSGKSKSKAGRPAT